MTQVIVTGLLIGGVLALLSSGLTLIFGVMRVVNFAQGEFVMLGMYLALLLVYLFKPEYPQILTPIVFVAFFILGAMVYWMTIRFVTGERFVGARGHDAQLILTLGISLVLQNGAMMFLGAKPHLLESSFSGAWTLEGILFNKPRTIGFAVAAIFIAGLIWFLQYSRTGLMLRATAEDSEAATYMGIDVGRSHALAFSLGTALAGVGGTVLATFYPVQPYVGEDFIVLMFVAVVLGGLGSVTGAVYGGLLIGLTQAVTPMLLPFELQNMGVFILFLLVLYFRPQGLFGKAGRV